MLGAVPTTAMNWPCAEASEVPAAVVTVTDRWASRRGRAIAVICVAELTVNEVAGVLPNSTAWRRSGSCR